jgi:hypothetical protein
MNVTIMINQDTMVPIIRGFFDSFMAECVLVSILLFQVSSVMREIIQMCTNFYPQFFPGFPGMGR